MSESQNDPTTIEQLEAQLRDDIAKTRKQRRNSLVGAVVLAVVMLGYLHFLLYVNIVEILDEKTLSEIVKAQVQQTIPTVQARVGVAMREQAPRLTEEFINRLEAEMPTIRKRVEAKVDETTLAAIARMDEQLDGLFETMLTEKEADIREAMRRLSDPQERMAFEKELDGEIEALYRKRARTMVVPYRVAIEETADEMSRLLTADPAKLSEWDRDRRDAVLTMTAYMEILVDRHGDAIARQLKMTARTIGRN